MTQQKHFDAKEAAKEIGISESLLRTKARNNMVRFKRRGDAPRGKMYFPAAEVRRLKDAYSI